MGSEKTTFTLKFRASAAGNLMPGGSGITEKQLVRLNDLARRKDGEGRALTPNLYLELEELLAKRDAPPEIGETGKRYVEKLWLKHKYGYEEPIVSDEMIKGNKCEAEGLELVSLLWPGEFRKKNKRFYQDDFFTGTPDTVLEKEPDVVEDIKSVWSLRTFFEKKELEPIYFAQGQVYMHLTKRTKFRVHYCLMNTPIELVHSEQKRLFWKYGGDEDNRDFQLASEQVARNHNFDHIPINERLKTFSFDYDPTFIAELQSKVILARQYFDTLKLV
jgi:hypothetical protein